MVVEDAQLEIFEDRQTTPLPPLFRWPGGKRWLVGRLRGLVPERYGRYIEPFFGGGALFFALRPGDALISDANADLMACYAAIRTDPVGVGKFLQSWEPTEERYYAIRESEPSTAAERAARTIFLTAHAFNGIYRVNKNGSFNVPWGGRPYPDLGSPELLARYSRALAPAEITAGDFEDVLRTARKGDFVYLDPPYTVAHSNNGFLKYNDKIFSWEDQQRLARVAATLDRTGCRVVVSNAYHGTIEELYPSFRSIGVSRHSVMAADAARRVSIQEYIFTNAPAPPHE